MRLPKPHTIADGLQAALGDLTWPPVRDLVAGVVTVSDPEIVAAMRLCFERLKVRMGASLLSSQLSCTCFLQDPLVFCQIQQPLPVQVVTEPSGAASLAAVLSPQFQEHPEWSKFKRVAVILSGGNIDMAAKGFWDLWA